MRINLVSLGLLIHLYLLLVYASRFAFSTFMLTWIDSGVIIFINYI
ncbi:hypothetical protein Nizo2535_2547 [Lactiplantibacillus plantarum]|nr:hypothetical protein Nizo2535_2547 [Lactiplantibacillus plantarum]KZU75004.1 hypothetical protein Nizo2891_2924 [Lactiplantibacillus plantarum]